MAEGWVLTAGDGRSSSTGSGDTFAQDIRGQATGNSGGVGGHPDHFWYFFNRDGLRGRWGAPDAMASLDLSGNVPDISPKFREVTYISSIFT